MAWLKKSLCELYNSALRSCQLKPEPSRGRYIKVNYINFFLRVEEEVGIYFWASENQWSLDFMKKADYLKELRGISQEALQAKVSDLQEELMNIRFKHASGQLEKVSELTAIRKRIAQLKTVINEQNALR
jgi:large subunit ribosomal protein L29